MANGEPSSFWATPSAQHWALHPRGLPTSLPDVLVAHPLSPEQARAWMGACQSASWTKPHRFCPAGIVCWFHQSPDSITLGLGAHRFVLHLDPAVATPLEVHRYLGGGLGWQPIIAPELFHHLILGWGRWSHRLLVFRLALADGQEQLASNGLHLQAWSDPHAGTLFSPPEQPVLEDEGYWPVSHSGLRLPLDQGVYGAALDRARAWLLRRWLRACRQAPHLRALRSWVVVHGARQGQALDHATSRALDCMRAIHQAATRPPQEQDDVRWQMPGRHALVATDLHAPRHWTGAWLEACIRGQLCFPSEAAARWWHALDANTARHLATALLSGRWGQLRLALVCQVLFPCGRIRFSRSAAWQLTSVPVRWWLAAWIQANPAAWQHLNAVSPTLLDTQSLHGHEDDNILVLANKANKLATEHSQALRGLHWLAQQFVQTAPAADLSNPSGASGRAALVRDWLWSNSNPSQEPPQAIAQLSAVQPHWRWSTLVRRFDKWTQAADFELALLATTPTDTQKNEAWPSALGRLQWSDHEILPVCTERALRAAGQRYLNCMRQDHHVEAMIASAVAGRARLFVVKGPTDSALVQLEKIASPGHPVRWRVQQCRGLANRTTSDEMEDLAHRLAQAYAWLEQGGPLEAGAALPAGEHAEDQAMAAPEVDPLTELSDRLRTWLESEPRSPARYATMVFEPGQTLSATPTFLSWEEVASPEVLLPCWLHQLRQQELLLPTGVSLRFEPCQVEVSMCGYRPVLSVPHELALDRLVKGMQKVWLQRATESPTGHTDITPWWDACQNGALGASSPSAPST